MFFGRVSSIAALQLCLFRCFFRLQRFSCASSVASFDCDSSVISLPLCPITFPDNFFQLRSYSAAGVRNINKNNVLQRWPYECTLLLIISMLFVIRNQRLPPAYYITAVLQHFHKYAANGYLPISQAYHGSVSLIILS